MKPAPPVTTVRTLPTVVADDGHPIGTPVTVSQERGNSHVDDAQARVLDVPVPAGPTRAPQLERASDLQLSPDRHADRAGRSRSVLVHPRRFRASRRIAAGALRDRPRRGRGSGSGTPGPAR